MRQPIQIFLFFILALSTFFKSHSQFRCGLTAGISSNNLNFDISSLSYTTKHTGIGFFIAAPVQYQLNKVMLIEVLPGIIQKNYSLARNNMFAGIKQEFKNTYFQLPIIFGGDIRKIKKITININTGFYWGYWISARVSGNIPNVLDIRREMNNTSGQINSYFNLSQYSEKYRFDKIKDNRFEFGYIIGIRPQYSINNEYSMFLNLSHYSSFTDQQKNYMTNQSKRYNQTYCFSTGLLLKVK